MGKPKDFESRSEMRPVKSPVAGANCSRAHLPSIVCSCGWGKDADPSPNVLARDAAVALLKAALNHNYLDARDFDAVFDALSVIS